MARKQTEEEKQLRRLINKTDAELIALIDDARQAAIILKSRKPKAKAPKLRPVEATPATA
jgi:hypothetical protein